MHGIKIAIEELDSGGYIVKFFAMHGRSDLDKNIFVPEGKLLAELEKWLKNFKQ